MKTLREQLRKAIMDHQKKDQGLVVNPDALTERLLLAVDRWLADQGKPAEWVRSDVDKWSREAVFQALRDATEDL